MCIRHQWSKEYKFVPKDKKLLIGYFLVKHCKKCYKVKSRHV